VPKPNPEAERLYSIAELAALWSVSRDTIERYLSSGRLAWIQVGRLRRIRASDAARLLEELERNVPLALAVALVAIALGALGLDVDDAIAGAVPLA